MRVTNISLSKDRLPDTITVEMSAREATLLTKGMGKYSKASAEEHLLGFYEASSEIYGELSGSVFDRYYDGVDDAYKDLW